jgi:hypothetical protein
MHSTQIISTMQNKAAQKKAIHHSSSTVFLALFSPHGDIDTEISLLNHFILKRGISDVIASVEIREINGTLVKSFKLCMNEERAYSIRVGEHVSSAFTGTVYVYFESNENLAVPFCAVMCSIKSVNSVCGVHTYGRRLEQKELGQALDLDNTVETGWTTRDSDIIKSFAALHGGAFELNLSVELEISNYKNKKLLIQRRFKLEPFGTLLIIPQNLSDDVVTHLAGKKGHIKVFIKGLRGIFPRMLCGNFSSSAKEFNSLPEAEEIQFTHTNFDFSTIGQPDAGGDFGYYNQPLLPNGYAIVYPVETKKSISIGQEKYISNSMHHISTKSVSQIEIKSEGENLPSRFVAAAIGTWKGSVLESECSTGIFIEDKLRVPCHWHWGLLKPGFENGESIISIILSKFNRNEDLSRTLKLRFFDEKRMLIEKDIVINGHQEIKTVDTLPLNSSNGAVWYVLSGDNMADLNIYSTYFPKNKAGFVEHAF